MNADLLPSIGLLLLSLTQLPAAVLYVDVNSAAPLPPYADWGTAATSIQDAVDAANTGDSVLVTNGIYQTGGRPFPGEVLTNRVTVTNAITLESVNGPAFTTVIGYQLPGSLNGDTAVRCVHLAEGTVLSGFTLACGATRQESGAIIDNQAHGGGAWCQSSNVFISNCILLSNYCSVYGGGVYSGTLSNCHLLYNGDWAGSFGSGGAAAYSVFTDSTLSSNNLGGSIRSPSPGIVSCTLSNCVVEGHLAGGAAGCFLDRCTVQNNTNQANGGGVMVSTLLNCMVRGNGSGQSGGGAYNSVLNNCTVSKNWAGAYGGGICIDGLATNTVGQSNIISGNAAGNTGGGIYLVGGGAGQTNRNLVGWMVLSNSTPQNRGGVYLTATLLVNGCTFEGNSTGGSAADSVRLRRKWWFPTASLPATWQ
jgi:hypothetical protein